jgi:ABC-2 type transport system ATP-binding protein
MLSIAEENFKLGSAVIQTTDLSFAYRRPEILHQINLKVPRGSIFGFLGPNGAGKSTTIKTLLGLLKVKTGMIRLFGKELNNNRLEILQRIGTTIEIPSLYEHLSARRNVEISQRLRRVAPARIEEVLKIVGLIADANKTVRQFSTGMKQRLSLALALLGKPELLLLDEPINGLDPEGIREIRNLLVKLNREEGCTIFLSSHILDEVEKICTHVAVIDAGRIMYQGETEGIRQKNSSGNILILETSDNAKCAGLFSDRLAGHAEPVISLFYQSKEDISMIIRKAVKAGIEIYSAKPESQRLEESFFRLLSEGGEA